MAAGEELLKFEVLRTASGLVFSFTQNEKFEVFFFFLRILTLIITAYSDRSEQIF